LKASILDLVENAQHTVNEGGRMRVDTGFLRWSGVSALNVIPRGPTHGDRKAKNSYLYDGGSLDATLAKMKMGDTFYFGWTAHYARYRELYDGFLEGAMQQWSRIVAFNADSLRRQVQK
jgi:hypothetical protein